MPGSGELSDTSIPRVHIPTSMNQLLSTAERNRNALIWAGGTSIMRKISTHKILRPREIIYLGKVPDLDKVSRTERYVEIGSCVSVNRLLGIGQHVLPPVLASSLRKIGPAAVRNTATVGGNLCEPDTRLNLYSVFSLFDVNIELRSTGKSRWIPISRLFDKEGNSVLLPGELMTRIRIPFDDWNIQYFQRIGDPYQLPKQTLNFCGLAKTQKGTITDVRFIFGALGKQTIRSRELESQIAGKKIPLRKKEVENTMEYFMEHLRKTGIKTSSFQRERIKVFLKWFITDRMLEE